MFKSFNEKGIRIVPISEINLESSEGVPKWIKNNASWWSSGVIDDETFVQVIEYIVQENIIKVTKD